MVKGLHKVFLYMYYVLQCYLYTFGAKTTTVHFLHTYYALHLWDAAQVIIMDHTSHFLYTYYAVLLQRWLLVTTDGIFYTHVMLYCCRMYTLSGLCAPHLHCSSVSGLGLAVLPSPLESVSSSSSSTPSSSDLPSSFYWFSHKYVHIVQFTIFHFMMNFFK